MSDWTRTMIIVVLVLAGGYAGILCIGRSRSRRTHPLPPGPPGLPWVGNVIGVNADAPWITHAAWARTYGNLLHCRLFGKDVIVINSEKIAKELLVDRSSNYSDRPYFITNELCGVEFNSIFMQYGSRWRRHRRIFHQTFRPAAAQRFVPYQDRKACDLLRRLLSAPKQLEEHILEYTTAIVLNGAYNYDRASRSDKLADIVADALKVITPALRPDVSIVIGAFPWLLYLPSWLPGMSFKRNMAKAREYSKRYVEEPFQYALQNAATNPVAPSMVHDELRETRERVVSPDEPWMQDVKEASATAFLAGSETSTSFLMTFFLMMLINRGAQEKAQAQIDALLGNTRPPMLDDRLNLPFVDAILRETLRYSPVVPMSIPHSTLEDDVYQCFYIPKGAFVIANVWAMAHDETRYPDPHVFTPERFLNEDGSLKLDDTEYITFGFGRRMCAGRYLAENTMWLAIAKVLSAFKILRPLDENGDEIPVEPKFSSGLAIRPLPFKYRIVPRFRDMDTVRLEQLIAASHA